MPPALEHHELQSSPALQRCSVPADVMLFQNERNICENILQGREFQNVAANVNESAEPSSLPHIAPGILLPSIKKRSKMGGRGRRKRSLSGLFCKWQTKSVSCDGSVHIKWFFTVPNPQYIR